MAKNRLSSAPGSVLGKSDCFHSQHEIVWLGESNRSGRKHQGQIKDTQFTREWQYEVFFRPEGNETGWTDFFAFARKFRKLVRMPNALLEP